MSRTALEVKASRKPKFSSRAYNRCPICGRPRAFMRQFGICRICFRAANCPVCVNPAGNPHPGLI